MLPEFDFYTGRNCDIYDENSQEARIIREMKQWAAEKLGEARVLEDIQEYEKAAYVILDAKSIESAIGILELTKHISHCIEWLVKILLVND